MAEEEWQPVNPEKTEDEWQPVNPQQHEPPEIPKPFLDRVLRGDALNRALAPYVAAAKGAGEAMGTESFGLSDEHKQQLRDAGIFPDPATGRGGAIRFMNEAVSQPIAAAGDLILRTGGAVVGGIAAAARQVVEDAEGALGSPQAAENETKNFLNYMLLRGDHEFGRVEHGPAGPSDHPIGILPRDQDFKTAAAVLGDNLRSKLGLEATEQNLHTLWEEKGIHPAEAVADAQNDALLKHDLTTPQQQLKGEPLPTVGLAPAMKAKDGTIYVGRPNGQHFEISEAHPVAERGVGWQDTGFVTPAGNFLDRKEALEWVDKNEKKIKSSVEGELDALDYREQVPLADRTAPDEAAPHALGSDVSLPMPSLEQQPPAPPGRLATIVKDKIDSAIDIGKDMQMKVAPMATGGPEARAIAKDFANALRYNRWEWSRYDDAAQKFTPEQRKRMWDAADEESVMRQEGREGGVSEHMGLATLEPEERAFVNDLQARSQLAWLKAKDLGMVEGEGLPAYTPRMVINVATAAAEDGRISLNRLPKPIGQNLRTTTAQLLHREHMTAEETEAAAKAKLGEGAQIVRDIRTLPIATSKLEDAIAGRTLINNIRDYGKRSGEDTVADFKPTDSEHKWFTVDHPAFKTWAPRFETVDGKTEAVRDANGDIVFEQKPLYVRDDFEGPLKAVLSQGSGAAYTAMMSLKGKTMGLIMNSPLIHNAVEWGRAIPAMPGKVATFKIYFEGNRAKNNPALMKEAIESGLVPIGHRFFNQDISSIAEAPNLTPGRSWTSQVAGFVPGLFDAEAGNTVKRAIDKAGDFWHNTLLWDRVADLQMGLYTNFRDSLLAKEVDQKTASLAAAHWANRYAGALPVEAMSASARKISNMLMFSRTFTLGNLGAMKDILTGLPADVMAQIERNMGTVDPATASFAKTMARRKAAAVVGLDIALMYVGNSLLQSAVNVMRRDKTLDDEMHGYADRLAKALQERKESPLKILQPFDFLQSVSATSENEPGKQDRVRVGYAKDGTAIYLRNPVGKIGEEFMDYASGNILDAIRRKMGTVARPLWQIMANDAGFGRKVYDPNADTTPKYMDNMLKIVEHIAASQTPAGQIGAFASMVKGEGDQKVNALQALGPVGGLTFSKGAPGGPAVGEVYHAREMHDYAVQAAMPDIRKQIQNGDISGAREAMRNLGIPPKLQTFYVRTTLNPALRLGKRTLSDFYHYATPEQIDRLTNAPAAGE